MNSGHPQATFDAALKSCLARRGLRIEQLCRPDDVVSRRLLREYGAMFVAAQSVRVPPACIFANAEEVLAFQLEATFRAAAFGPVQIELQPAAMTALLAARRAAQHAGFDITPRGGTEAARRSYADTLRLWDSRFHPALRHWHAQNRLPPEEVDRLRRLTPRQQVAAVLELERGGLFFSRDFTKSVLYSVAPPGASQHLSMLAFDVVEFGEGVVRSILARHGWFQTVLSDLPHFTFLGVEEAHLPARGLRRHIEANGQIFWIPNAEADASN